MRPLRILVLGSYPALQPRHGGQIRLSQIMAAYQARGHQVRQASFFPAHLFYTQSLMGEGDVALPVAKLHEWQGLRTALVEDLMSGEVVAQDVSLLAALERHAGVVDLLHLEQPWLLPVVRKLRERGAIGAFRLVYGSQNIEHVLKRAILRQHEHGAQDALAAAVLARERECAEQADLVAAVTPEDAQVLAAWTAAPVVLAGNGVAPWQAAPEALAHWRERLGEQPFALYVASAHPPNIQGLRESFGASLAGLAPTQKLVLAGHVCEFVLKSDWFMRWPEINQQRLIALGVLSHEDLSAVRELAHTFLLPVTAGGGSNLKTPEALYSGRYVVATPLALRGFESFSHLPGVCIAPPGASFARAVSRSLQQAPLPRDDAAARQRVTLTWPHVLSALCDAVESLAPA